MAIAKNADQQQSFIVNNNVDTSAIKSIADTPFPPSATGRPTRSNSGNRDTQITTQQSRNRILDQQAPTFCQHGRAGKCREWKYMQSSITIFVTMGSFPPSAAGTPQQQQQLQLEIHLTIAGVAIVTQTTTWCNNQHGVRNAGLDRRRVDDVVADRATRMQTDNHNDHGNRETTITHSIGCCSGMWTGNHEMSHGL